MAATDNEKMTEEEILAQMSYVEAFHSILGTSP